MKLSRKIKLKMQDKPLMISCREFEEFVADYFEGNLSFLTRLKFNMHLLMCGICRKYIKQYKKTIEIEKEYYQSLDEGFDEEPPDELIEIVRKLKKNNPDS